MPTHTHLAPVLLSINQPSCSQTCTLGTLLLLPTLPILCRWGGRPGALGFCPSHLGDPLQSILISVNL